MKMARLLCIALTMLLLWSLSISAHGATAKGEGSTQFTFWYCISPEHEHLMTELLAEYNKEKPHQVMVARNFRAPRELYSALMEGKETPDVALIDSSWMEELVNKGKLEAVEDQMLKIASSIRVVAKMDTFKPLWNSCVMNEKLYIMPYYAVNHAFMYNPAFFKDKGITKPPVCWGDIVEMGKKLTDSGTGTWGYYIPLSAQPKDLAYLYEIFLWQAGGDVYSPTELKVAYDSEFGQKALQFWVDVIHKHKIAPSRPLADLSKVGMLLGTPKDFLESSKKGVNFKVVSWPIKNKQVGDIEITSVAIFKSSPERMEKLWQFTYWLTEFPQASKWALQTPYLPANKQVTLSPMYFEYLQKYPGIRTFIALLEKGCAKPGMKDWDYETIMGDLGEKISEALSGKVTVQEALNKAAVRANSIIRRETGSKGKTSTMETKAAD
jgi:multiple sugar transport system substrate-binding protein